MSREQEAAYWEDYRVVGSLFGLADSDMPATLDDLRDYRRDMLEGDVLHVTDWARERARSIVLEPPVPWLARPLLETVNFITVTLLPDRIRREYGFRPAAAGAGAPGAGRRRRRVREAGGDPVPAGPDPAGALRPSRVISPAQDFLVQGGDVNEAPIVSAKDVSREFGKGDAVVHALNGVSIDFPRGQVHRDHGPVGLGQVDAHALPGRP